MALYFLPHGSKKPTLCPTRPRVVKWYCPFASQRHFPSGHRYCVNVYTGCSHACEYCYAASYEPAAAGVKRDFARSLDKDLADLERFDVPPAPIHLSNSTDPFQPLERDAGHARLALWRILDHRGRFTTGGRGGLEPPLLHDRAASGTQVQHQFAVQSGKSPPLQLPPPRCRPDAARTGRKQVVVVNGGHGFSREQRQATSDKRQENSRTCLSASCRMSLVTCRSPLVACHLSLVAAVTRRSRTGRCRRLGRRISVSPAPCPVACRPVRCRTARPLAAGRRAAIARPASAPA